MRSSALAPYLQREASGFTDWSESTVELKQRRLWAAEQARGGERSFSWDQYFASVFVTAPDSLNLHMRRHGSRVASTLPVVCLPGLARTAADFHPLAAALARPRKAQ
jgi:hypothetical protein